MADSRDADSLTGEQRKAVEQRGVSVVLSSGAGCGKTHVLTSRYLSHLARDHTEIGQLVAITFTDRAARVMRERIRLRIQKLPDPEHHLRDLERADIATIHGFASSLLRRFAVQAGLDPSFEILDEVLAANLRARALERSLRNLLEAPANDLSAIALKELIVLYGYPATIEALEEFLFDVDRPRWEGWLRRKPEAIADDWVGPKRRELLPKWVAYLCAASPKIARTLALLESVSTPNAVVMDKVRRLLAETPRLHEAADLDAAIAELVSLAKVQGTKKPDWGNDELYDQIKDAFTDFRGDLKNRFESFTATADGAVEAARIGQQFLRVALAIDHTYREEKRAAGVLDYQDLLVRARNLLRDHTDIRDSLRERYRFVLVDELQDTDPVQMELIELLCGAGLEHGKLFAVGDRKQSIYRFRGAEVELFEKLNDRVASEGRLGLTLNFRSQPGIIRFVNALFSRRMEEYQPLCASRSVIGNEPNVEFQWAVAEGRVEEVRAAEAEAIARRIVELLADEAPRLPGKDGAARRVMKKDIALLFRSMTNVAIYETALRNHGLDYYLVRGRAFFAQQEVYDLLNLLRAVENPLDSLCLVGVLRSPFFGMCDDAIYLVARHPDGPWAGLRDGERLALLPAEQQPAARRAARLLADWRILKDRLSVARLLNRVLADTGYDAALQYEFLGERKLANLWKLIDLARTFDATGLFGLHEFVERLGDLVARQPREDQASTLPEESDVIKLMSIHQAKGEEFPVVFIPDFAAQPRGGRHPVARWHRSLGCLARVPAEFDNKPDEEPPFSSFGYDLGGVADQLADWQEDLRLHYVACTRAEDLLVLSAGVPAATGPLPPNHGTVTLEERFDPRTGACRADDVDPESRLCVRVRQSVVDADAQGRSPIANRRRDSAPAVRIVELPGRYLPRSVALAELENADAIVGDALRFVLDRWDFSNPAGWKSAVNDLPDVAMRELLNPRLVAFAASPVRAMLANARELHRNVESRVELGEVLDSDEQVQIHGTIDFLYRDDAGWHVTALEHRSTMEVDQLLGRKHGLTLQGWAVFRQLGSMPSSIELYSIDSRESFKISTGEAAVRAAAEHFLRALKTEQS